VHLFVKRSTNVSAELDQSSLTRPVTFTLIPLVSCSMQVVSSPVKTAVAALKVRKEINYLESIIVGTTNVVGT